MAEGASRYLREVVGTKRDLVGWSDGAVVALLVAMADPDLVRRVILIGQYFTQSGSSHDQLDLWVRTPEAKDVLRGEYDLLSPDGPDHFDVVHAKMLSMLADEPEVSLNDLGSVTAPALVMQGDRDIVTVEHSLEVVRELARGRLAVLPDTHLLPLECPDLVNSLVIQFLDAKDV